MLSYDFESEVNIVSSDISAASGDSVLTSSVAVTDSGINRTIFNTSVNDFNITEVFLCLIFLICCVITAILLIKRR